MVRVLATNETVNRNVSLLRVLITTWCTKSTSANYSHTRSTTGTAYRTDQAHQRPHLILQLNTVSPQTATQHMCGEFTFSCHLREGMAFCCRFHAESSIRKSCGPCRCPCCSHHRAAGVLLRSRPGHPWCPEGVCSRCSSRSCHSFANKSALRGRRCPWR